MVRQSLIPVLLVAMLALAACSSSGKTAQERCPVREGTEVLTDERHNYCLSYPTGYSVEHPNDNETVLVAGSLLNVEQPRAYIETDSAAGRTAAQVADELLAEFEAALPGFAIARTETTVDGETAVVLDNVPGQDVSRQVVIVHNDRLYTLTFVPADENLAEVYTQMENLYTTVIDSFKLLPGE